MENKNAVETSKKFDLVGSIMAYEDGQLDENETIEFFQNLLTSGMIHQLQGSYQRTAQSLIIGGYIK